jgi:heme-degrading monooxygenase HmoA
MSTTTVPTIIRTDTHHATEICFLHCADDRQREVTAAAVADAQRLADQDGFVAVNVLRSTDGSRVCLYNQWRAPLALAAARAAAGDPGWDGLIDTDSGGPRLYDIVYADDRSPDGVSIIGHQYRGITFINEIRTLPSGQDRLLELVIANNEASSWKTPGYRSANFHKSRDGARAVNVSLWDSEAHLIEAISEMAATDVNLEETIAIANPDFRFYELAYANHV